MPRRDEQVEEVWLGRNRIRWVPIVVLAAACGAALFALAAIAVLLLA